MTRKKNERCHTSSPCWVPVTVFLPRARREGGQQGHPVSQRMDQRLRGARGLVPGHTPCAELGLALRTLGCCSLEKLTQDVRAEASHLRGGGRGLTAAPCRRLRLRARPCISFLHSGSELPQHGASAALVMLSLLGVSAFRR